MFKESIVKGCLLGLVTGLLVTVFDSLFVLKQPVYVPYLYPVALIVFNILFWALIGSISGFLLWMFNKETSMRGKEAYHWVLFYLMPFVIIYGVLGRVPTPPVTVINRPHNPVFDYHVSFVWATLILFFVLFYYKLKETNESFSPLSLSLELVTVMIVFQFCSNPGYIRTFSLISHLQTNPFLSIPPEYLMVVSYTLGVLCIGGFYFIAFFTVRPIFNKMLVKRDYSITTLVFFAVTALVCFIFVFNHMKVTVMKDVPLEAARGLRQERKVPYVILIVLDTLRADRLSIYNDNIKTSKNLKKLSEDSLVFEQCIASSPWTLPSHASLFTGLYVSEHKCEFLISPLPILSKSSITLAEIFAHNGYKTAAVVSNFGWLNPKFNLNQGFQIYNCSRNIGLHNVQPFRPLLFVFSYLTNSYSKILFAYKTADDINREAVNLLGALYPEPFFLFLNYMDTHTPYQPPRPFDRSFLDKKFPQLYRLTQYVLRLLGKHDKSLWDSYLLSQYDGEVAYLDNQLGELFSQLKRMGMYDSSLIVVTSDHGELLGEHGLYEHHANMYEGVLKVPLIIKFPFSKKVGREKGLINLTDVFATVLSTCDLPLPDSTPGALPGGTAYAVAELYSFVLGEHRALYEGNYKYMEYRDMSSRAKRRAELYDVIKDPHERENVLEHYPDVASAMEMKLQEWGKKHAVRGIIPQKSTAPLSKELQENLKALGYVVEQ
jgi:arylsulfatase A-like enzyme